MSRSEPDVDALNEAVIEDDESRGSSILAEREAAPPIPGDQGGSGIPVRS